ncbi:TatD family deoxyribonuclease [Candidatus Thorarchaeota archaeon]|nr:MAG: TatD family deoxyribonuclease [Candidatus Thorarchaeota archaeon]
MKWDYVDTHCHVEQEEFAEDRDWVINRALDSGIAMITSAIRPGNWDTALHLSESYDGVFVSIGLDPTCFELYDAALDFIREHHAQIVGVGEVGLDHYIVRDHERRELQEHVFQEFIRLAKDLKKPIQVHSRSAGKKALDVLEDVGASRVHMHAFDARASYAKRASEELGYYFSIPTSVARSRQKQKLVKAVDIEHLLLETDSPVLGPEKGERNEPGNISIALQEVSRILQEDEEDLRQTILDNTLRLYKGLR